MDPSFPWWLVTSLVGLLAFGADVLLGLRYERARPWWAAGQVVLAVALAAAFVSFRGPRAGAEFAVGWAAAWVVCVDLAIVLLALSGAAARDPSGPAQARRLGAGPVVIAVGCALVVRSLLVLAGPGFGGRWLVAAFGVALVGFGWWCTRFPERAMPVRPGFAAAAAGALFALSAVSWTGGRSWAALCAGLLALLGARHAFRLIDRMVARMAHPEVALSVLLAFAGVKCLFTALIGVALGEAGELVLLSCGVLAVVFALSAMTTSRLGSHGTALRE